jgi:Creatinase/Prolidase N-terminal domain
VHYRAWHEIHAQHSCTSAAVASMWINNRALCSVWEKRPVWPTAPTRIHQLAHAGWSAARKISIMRGNLVEASCDALVVTDLAEVAWLFNMRGGDVECNPVFVAYATVTEGSATLYMHDGKVGPEVQVHLEEAGVTIGAYDDVCLLLLLISTPLSSPAARSASPASSACLPLMHSTCPSLHSSTDLGPLGAP